LDLGSRELLEDIGVGHVPSYGKFLLEFGVNGEDFIRDKREDSFFAVEFIFL